MAPYLETVSVPISSTVRDVRLRLQNLKGWHADKEKCSLVWLTAHTPVMVNLCACTHANIQLIVWLQVLGDRDLLEHEVVGQLAERTSASPDYLHVFVKLADVASVSMDNGVSHKLAFDTTDSPVRNLSPRSALTHSLASATSVKMPDANDR